MEGQQGHNHDGLDVEDHVDRVGEAQVGLLHDELGQGPPYPRQEAEIRFFWLSNSLPINTVPRSHANMDIELPNSEIFLADRFIS